LIESIINAVNNQIPSTLKKTEKNHETGTLDLSLLEDYSGDDMAVKKQMVQVFYKQSLEHLALLKKMDADQHSQWTNTAHALKGSAAYLGARELLNLCEKAEALNKKDSERKKYLYKKIEKEHETVCNLLKSHGLLNI
jgi:HPt (histidine-containing phosphotransfer) domain-containing protein